MSRHLQASVIATLLICVACRPQAPGDPAASRAPAPPALAPAPAPTPPFDLDEVRLLLRTERPGPRREFLEVAERLFSGDNRYLGQAPLLAVEEQLRLEETLPPDVRGDAETRHVEGLLRAGRPQEAARAADDLVAWLGGIPGAPQAMRLRALRLQGMAYLRLAEDENCVKRHQRECCIFPLAGGGVHSVKAPAERAKQAYLAIVEARPDDQAARWLLNLAFMALGDYPQGVPAEHLIPPERFASAHDPGRFVDVAPDLGLDLFALAGGALGDDFDGDGLIDIVTSTSDPGGPLTFMRNVGDGTFEDRSAASKLDQQLGGLDCLSADYDGDGDADILVMRGGWLTDDGQVRKSLLRNEGDASFTDVTAEAGLSTATRPSQAAAWADYDLDGDLDLYIGNESRLESGGTDYPSQLFRNEGGTFVDVTEHAGVANHRLAKGVAWGDYDNDGDPDLYVSNAGLNRLYRNRGDGTFEDAAPELHVTEPSGRSFAAWFFDVDNDGWLDLWVSAFDAVVEDVARDVLRLPNEGDTPRLYMNDHGRFRDRTEEMGLARVWLPMGASFGDIDNDGWLDMYLATGDPEYETLTPNVLLWNDHGRRFLDATTAAGMGHLQKGHGVVFADFDEDGDQDVFNELGGFYPGDRFRSTFYLNPGHGNHHLKLRLQGTSSPRSGFGARVRVVVRTPKGPREIHRAPGCVSSFGGSPRRLEIGLGDAISIERVEIRWPRSPAVQVVEGVPLDSFIEVTEGTPGMRRVDLPPIALRVGP